MLSKDQELVTMAMREVRAELRRIPSQSVQDSATIYLEKLRDRLAELFQDTDARFDPAEFVDHCELPLSGDDAASKAA